MTIVVGMHQAKMHFSQLVKRAQAGDEIIVEKFGSPLAKIVPYAPERIEREPGLLAGRITINPGFEDLPPGFAEPFGA